MTVQVFNLTPIGLLQNTGPHHQVYISLTLYIVPNMLYFVLQRILTHVKQVVRSGPAFCNCSADHNMAVRWIMFTVQLFIGQRCLSECCEYSASWIAGETNLIRKTNVGNVVGMFALKSDPCTSVRSVRLFQLYWLSASNERVGFPACEISIPITEGEFLRKSLRFTLT